MYLPCSALFLYPPYWIVTPGDAEKYLHADIPDPPLCLRWLCCWATGLPDTLDQRISPKQEKKTSQARPDMRSQLVLSKSTMISDRRSEYTLENERLELKNGGDRWMEDYFTIQLDDCMFHVTGWWFQPMKNIGQNRNLPPNRDEHKKHVKPPPRLILHGGSKGKTSSNSKTQTQSPRCYQNRNCPFHPHHSWP